MKNYFNTISIKEKTFDNGGSILKVRINAKELIKIAGEDGWVGLDICKRREPSEKGVTHYAVVDKWKKD